MRVTNELYKRSEFGNLFIYLFNKEEWMRVANELYIKRSEFGNFIMGESH